MLELVKRAKEMNILEPAQNNKLETMSKAMGIEHTAAHTALSDIKATRRLYEIIYFKSKGGKYENGRQR